MSTKTQTPPSSTLAPWAEIVFGVGPKTVDELEALPDDGWAYELGEGVLVRMPHSGGEASQIARRLAGRLGDFVDDHALGAVTGADGGYILDPMRPKETELAPDVGFMRAGRVRALDRDAPLSARRYMAPRRHRTIDGPPNRRNPRWRRRGTRLYVRRRRPLPLSS